MQDDKSSKNPQRISLKHQVPRKTRSDLHLWSQCTFMLTKDGAVASFDMRTNSPIYRQSIHKGSVNCLKVV